MAAAPVSHFLPPLVAATVTAETRLAYVMQHFRQVYEPVPAVAVGYADTQSDVIITEGAGDFFQQTNPYPAAPNWRPWAGQSVPFFFDARPEMELLTLGDNQATIQADIIAGAFFLLSGWQEYFSETRDQHGRFPYAASVQQLYGFVALPVVNYYFEVLKTAIEHVTEQVLRVRPWRVRAPFAAFITHDVDNLHSAWKGPAKAALRQGRLWQFGQLCWQHLRRPDGWNNLAAVAATTAGYGARSTFFILPAHRPGADGTPNADYRLAGRWLAELRELVRSRRCEIGLHGSIGTAAAAFLLQQERARLPFATAGLRFHYLRWEPRSTPHAVESAGFAYDSTLGFAEHFGFRHSYCHPFSPFSFQAGEAHRFLEFPLNVMDTTLHHPRYLQLAPAEILPALRPMLAEIERFGGVATVLWHNENFDPANTANGPHAFGQLMQLLQERGAAFLTAPELGALLP